MFDTLRKEYEKLYLEHLNNPNYLFTSDSDTITIIQPIDNVELVEQTKLANEFATYNNCTYKPVIRFDKFKPENFIDLNDDDTCAFVAFKSLERAFYNDLELHNTYTGTYLKWHSNSEHKSTQGNMFKGEKNGMWVTFDEHNNIVSKTEYLNGLTVSKTTYETNGNVITEAKYDENGELHGMYKKAINSTEFCTIFYENGKIFDNDCFNKCLEKLDEFEGDNEDKNYCYAVLESLPLIIVFEENNTEENMTPVAGQNQVFDEFYAQYTAKTIVPLLIFNKFDTSQEFTVIKDMMLNTTICEIGKPLNNVACFESLEVAFYNGIVPHEFTGQPKIFLANGMLTNTQLNLDKYGDTISEDLADFATKNALKIMNLENNAGIERLCRTVMGKITSELMNEHENGTKEVNMFEMAIKIAEGMKSENIFVDDDDKKTLTDKTTGINPNFDFAMMAKLFTKKI